MSCWSGFGAAWRLCLLICSRFPLDPLCRNCAKRGSKRYDDEDDGNGDDVESVGDGGGGECKEGVEVGDCVGNNDDWFKKALLLAIFSIIRLIRMRRSHEGENDKGDIFAEEVAADDELQLLSLM